MRPDEAIALLDQQICPKCGAKTAPEIEVDEEDIVAFERCRLGHFWFYWRFSEDRSTNAFEGEFDPKEIEERLEDYGL